MLKRVFGAHFWFVDGHFGAQSPSWGTFLVLKGALTLSDNTG